MYVVADTGKLPEAGKGGVSVLWLMQGSQGMRPGWTEDEIEED